MARRPPKNVTPIIVEGPVTKTITVNGSPGTSTATVRILEDRRPSYPYGARRLVLNKRWINPTAYSHYSREIVANNSSFVRSANSAGTIAYTFTDPYPDVFSAAKLTSASSFDTAASIPYGLRAKAEVDALNEIGDSKAGLGEDIATYAQTVSMFRNKGVLLKDLLNAFRKDRGMKKYLLSSFRQIAKSGDKIAANAFLEYVYGWKPLMEDIHGVSELLKEFASGSRPMVIHGTGKAYEEFQNSTDLTIQKHFAVGNVTSTGSRKVRCDLHGYADPDAQTLRVLNQLGLVNPASLAYELLPWSFVVDWFVPVGPCLSAITAPMGLKFISGSTSFKETCTHTGEFAYCNAGPVVLQKNPSNFVVQDESFRRVVHTSWPNASPYISLDPFKGDRSFKALALAISNLQAERNRVR